MALKNVPKTGPLTLTLRAQAAITVAPVFVKFHSDNAYFVVCGAGEQAIGVCPSLAAIGDPVTIELAPSLTLVKLGDTVAAGDWVASTAAGLADTATAGQVVAGIAITGGASGELATIKLVDPVAEASSVVVDKGKAVLVAGTKTVSVADIDSTDVILLTRQVTGGTVGNLSVGTVTTDTSFVINSDSATETSTISWVILR